MALRFKNIAVIARQPTPGTAKTLATLIKLLRKIGVNVFLEHETSLIFPQVKIKIVNRNKLKDSCDLIIVIGGDGSLISASHVAALQNLPVIGINRGKLGFLTDITPKNLDQIDQILKGNFHEEHRFFLQAKIAINKKVIAKSIALNDVALFSYTAGHLIELEVYLNHQFLCDYRADGLIISTPTGSTAHALSSGGPIIYPTLDNITIVPVLSHNLSSRPIVISNKNKITINFKKTNPASLLVLCDGQSQTMLQGGTITISKTKAKLRLLHPPGYNYFESLRSKLNWEKKHKKT
jgi:NAD+ kinase